MQLSRTSFSLLSNRPWINAKPITRTIIVSEEGYILQIYDAAKAVMSSKIQPTIEKLNVAKTSAAQQASMLKETSISKANELLSTQYGNMAIQGVDNTSILLNGLLDRYFPPVEGEEETPGISHGHIRRKDHLRWHYSFFIIIEISLDRTGRANALFS